MGSLLRMQIERVVIALETRSTGVPPQSWWESRELWDVYFLKFRELTECLWDHYLKPLTSECARKDIQQEFGQDVEAIHELCDAACRTPSLSVKETRQVRAENFAPTYPAW